MTRWEIPRFGRFDLTPFNARMAPGFGTVVVIEQNAPHVASCGLQLGQNRRIISHEQIDRARRQGREGRGRGKKAPHLCSLWPGWILHGAGHEGSGDELGKTGRTITGVRPRMEKLQGYAGRIHARRAINVRVASRSAGASAVRRRGAGGSRFRARPDSERFAPPAPSPRRSRHSV